MAAEHDHFVGFVAAANLADRVVGSCAFRVNTIDDIKLENNFSAVIKDPADATEIFVAHHYCRYRFVDVKCLVIESAYLSNLTTGIVNSNFRAVRFEKSVHLLVELTIRQRS